MTEPAYLEPAHDRRHEYVHDRETGAWISLEQFCGTGDYGDLVETRVRLQLQSLNGEPRYVCPRCDQPMKVASRPIPDRHVARFYFKHVRDDGSCSGVAGLSAKAICALKYNHLQEGAQHKQFKAWLLTSLDADPSFSSVRTERRWRAERRSVDDDGVKWRQPDVQASWGDERIAFEVQLSTTFLHVITERMQFYSGNNGRLLWLFRDLDPTDFKLAEDDIFYSNNRNAFRVTAATVARSVAERRFVLEALWHVPVIRDERYVDTVERGLVYFDELTLDVSPAGVPRAFFFDYDAAKAALPDQALRDAIESLMASYYPVMVKGSDQDLRLAWEERWLDARYALLDRDLAWPERFAASDGPFYHCLAAYSAKLGKVVGWGHGNYIGLANRLFDGHKRVLWLFSVLMTHYARVDQFMAHGDQAKWAERRATYRNAWRDRDPAFAADHQFDHLLKFLFPDAPEKLWRGPIQS